MPILPSATDVRSAAKRIRPHIRRTPLVRSDTLSAFLGGDVWLKCECDQATGSFKLRGATNVLALMDAAARARGVVASSAGNHGAGIAAAAHALGVACTVYVPGVAPAAKRDRIAAMGATVDASAPHYDAAEALARSHAARTGAQSDRTDAMARALAANAAADDPHLPTICDGLAGLVDEEMLAQGRAALKRIAVSSERAVRDAVAYLWIEEGIRVEGAGAAGVAAVLAGTAGTFEFPLAIVLSGGNIDPDAHAGILNGSGTP